MKIGHQIVYSALGAVALAVATAHLIQHRVISRQGVDLAKEKMRTAVLEAEGVRESISSLSRKGAFDRAKLLEEYKRTGDLRGSTLYETILVVAAWRAIVAAAEKEGMPFRVPKHQARNSDCAMPVRAQRPWIIALTVNAMAGDRNRWIESGMDDYLTKPIKLPDLHAALVRVVIPTVDGFSFGPESPCGVRVRANVSESRLSSLRAPE